VFRYLSFALGTLIGIPLLGLLLLLPLRGLSFGAIVYLLSGVLIVIGMVCTIRWTRLSSMLVWIGSLLVLGTTLIRILFPPSASQLRLVTLPGPAPSRFVNRIFNEQDIVLAGARFGPYLKLISPREANSLIPAFSHAFHEMKQFDATPLSPFLATYLGQQGVEKFDLVVAEPRTVPKSGIIFLHGFGGSFTVQCWLVAKVGYQINAITVCPSTSPSGHWWNSQGQSILQETIFYLRQRGVKRIYLAGLSNGGIAASRLANQFQSDLAGLILISGADPSSVIAQLPALVITGESDERIPVSMIERYVAVSGTRATYHRFDGDHFLLLKQTNLVQKAIVDWLVEQEANFQEK